MFLERNKEGRPGSGGFVGLGQWQEDPLIVTCIGSPEMGVCPRTDSIIDFILPLWLTQKHPKSIPSWPDLG